MDINYIFGTYRTDLSNFNFKKIHVHCAENPQRWNNSTDEVYFGGSSQKLDIFRS